MKTLKLTLIALSALTLGITTSCKKKSSTPEETTTDPAKGTVTLSLNHQWGMMNEQDFVLGTDLIHPMHNDTLNFSKLKYYISNVKLKKADGSYWSHPNSYFLVDIADTNSTKLLLANVPAGDYTDLEYTLGVDSARNVSGAQTGVLDPSNTMFWSWNSGYIMLKAEGIYKMNKADSLFTFHLGGFKGANNIITKKTVSFSGNNLTVKASKTSKVNFIVNPGTLFHTTSVKTIDVIHMPGTAAKSMALDFFTHTYGFMFDSIEE